MEERVEATDILVTIGGPLCDVSVNESLIGKKSGRPFLKLCIRDDYEIPASVSDIADIILEFDKRIVTENYRTASEKSSSKLTSVDIEVRTQPLWNSDEWSQFTAFLLQIQDSIQLSVWLHVYVDLPEKFPWWQVDSFSTSYGFSTRHSIQYPPNLDQPITWSNPVRLQNISFSLSSLTEEHVDILARILEHPSSQLEGISMSDTNFPPGGATRLAQGLQRHSTGSLEALYFAECGLSDNQICLIVRGLLQDNIDENDDAFKARPNRYPLQLQDLDLSFNKCKSSAVDALKDFLRRTEASCKLNALNLGFQAYGERRSVPFQDLVKTFAEQTLSVSQLSIPGTVTQLRRLDLGGNNLDDSYLLQIRTIVKHHPTLEDLDISKNRFTGKGLDELMKDLPYTQQLKYLGLEDLSGLSKASISTALKAFQDNTSIYCNLRMIEVDEELKEGPAWVGLQYQLDWNWGTAGWRRLLLDNSTQGQSFEGNRKECPRVGLSIWPMILGRLRYFPGHRAAALTYTFLSQNPALLVR